MKMSNSLKKRFVKDFNIPIDVFSEPFFMERINLLDTYLNTKDKLNLLEETIQELGSEDAFFKESQNIIVSAQEEVEENEKFIALKQDKLEEEIKIIRDTKSKYNVKKDLYKEYNIGKKFISIDLKEANFNAFKNYGIFSEKTFEDFLEKYTSFEYFLKSKMIRQIVFGSLLPKKQIILEEYEVSKILNQLNIQNNKNIIMNKDEIVFEVDNYEFNCLFETNFPVKIEKFTLEELRDLNGNLSFVKRFIDNRFEIKGLSKLFFIQGYKKLLNLPIERNDLAFYYEKNLAYFDKPIF